jgi:hypothetical protein
MFICYKHSFRRTRQVNVDFTPNVFMIELLARLIVADGVLFATNIIYY